MRICTTSSFWTIRFSRFASVFVDPGLVVFVAVSPVIFVPVSSASVLGNLLPVALLSVTVTIDSVLLILCLVPCVSVVVYGDVYGAVLIEGGHVNIPTFVELQIRSLTKVHNRKIMQSSVSNSKQRTKQN